MGDAHGRSVEDFCGSNRTKRWFRSLHMMLSVSPRGRLCMRAVVQKLEVCCVSSLFYASQLRWRIRALFFRRRYVVHVAHFRAKALRIACLLILLVVLVRGC